MVVCISCVTYTVALLPNWRRGTQEDAQEYLVSIWARIESELSNETGYLQG